MQSEYYCINLYKKAYAEYAFQQTDSIYVAENESENRYRDNIAHNLPLRGRYGFNL